MVAGGSDSTSATRLELPASLMQKVAPVALSKKSGVMDYLKLMGKISPRRDLMPKRPAIAERTTGELMGEACERMAERNDIAREDQDRLALASHQRAAAAIADGRFDGEVIAVETKRGTVRDDQIVRGDSSLERLAKLRAAFADGGTLTAGNSSTLTDGAGAVLLMSEEKAQELGLTPLAAVRSWSYVGVDPADQLLIGPALAMPEALDRAGKHWMRSTLSTSTRPSRPKCCRSPRCLAPTPSPRSVSARTPRWARSTRTSSTSTVDPSP